ncbi:MAG: 3-methyladenine DNA glycosylase [Dermatophilaceae bacterium]
MVDILSPTQWHAAEAAHESRVDAATAGHRARRADGRAHPVEDFLFTYYQHSPAQLRRWHPGAGVVLSGGAGSARAGWRHYRADGEDVLVDLVSFAAARHGTMRFVHDLLTATLSRPAFLGCAGLHEWAMVYRLDTGDVRHPGWPLRLGRAGTDEVVERHVIRCTHVDAYRFFTDDARPRNTVSPSRATQGAFEQPGCLHAAMDVYKWCTKLTPLVPSVLVADAFDLAREVRVLDMQASPYDLRELGHDPVRIETATGRAEYRERQRVFAERSNALRRRLLTVLDAVPSGIDAVPSGIDAVPSGIDAVPTEPGAGTSGARTDRPAQSGAATNQPPTRSGTTSSAP